MATLRCLQFLLIFGTTLFSISNACQTCSSPWKMVYENDALGQTVSGNLTELTDAHERGARIRYMVPSLGVSGYVEELDFSLAFLDVLCGESVVHVTKDRWDHFLDDGQWRFVIICTDGALETYEYSLGSPAFINQTATTVAIKWFVLESSCSSFVYSHEGNGSAISGSKDDLKNAVMSGYDVRFRIEEFYVIPCHNMDISKSSGEVVGQVIWNINTPEFGAAQWWFQMINSNGLIDTQVWDLGEHVSPDHSHYHEAVDWMVEPCWRHAYTNDEHGVGTSGSLADLIAAVEHGQRVKVVIGTHSIEADNLRTNNGHVSAQLLSQVAKKNEHYLRDNSFWVWQMVHTTGTVRTRRYSIGNEINRGDTAEMKTISWFVDTRRWKNVLSTTKHGCRSGSKAELKSAIENGATVRVALQLEGHSDYHDPKGWFVMKAEGLEFGPSGEVAAELIKSVSVEAFCSTEFQIQNGPFWRFMIVTTEGNVDISQWRVGAHVDDGHYTEQADVNWFVSY